MPSDAAILNDLAELLSKKAYCSTDTLACHNLNAYIRNRSDIHLAGDVGVEEFTWQLIVTIIDENPEVRDQRGKLVYRMAFYLLSYAEYDSDEEREATIRREIGVSIEDLFENPDFSEFKTDERNPKKQLGLRRILALLAGKFASADKGNIPKPQRYHLLNGHPESLLPDITERLLTDIRDLVLDVKFVEDVCSRIVAKRPRKNEVKPSKSIDSQSAKEESDPPDEEDDQSQDSEQAQLSSDEQPASDQLEPSRSTATDGKIVVESLPVSSEESHSVVRRTDSWRILWFGKSKGSTVLKRVLIILILGLFLLGCIFWSLKIWFFAPATVADQVAISNVTSESLFKAERFWVPANASLASLPIDEVNCGGPNIAGGMIDWLKKYGSLQDSTQEITVRNLSRADDLITISDVTAVGQAKEAATPGFFIDCPSTGVGAGGDIQWSYLKIRLADGAQAKISTTETSSYFSRVVGKGTSAGLNLSLGLDSYSDFRGRISAKLEQTGFQTSVVTLPSGAIGSDGILEWHGVPQAKFLAITPGPQGSGAFLCKYSDEINTSSESCTIEQIKQRLIASWGEGVVK